MKYAALILALLAFSFSLWSSYQSKQADIQLAKDYERVCVFNVRRERRLKWMEYPESIDLETVANAEHLLGTPAHLVAALVHCENGPQDIETGSIDKTDYWAQHFPIKYWSTLDGAKTLNRLAWAWFEAHPKEFKAFLLDAALPYTDMNKPMQAAWAANMYTADQRYRTSLGSDSSPASALAVAAFTPTPDYGFQDPHKGKAKGPARKAQHNGGKKR